jgi:uncharacterized membrane protein YhaH (DUF805 family)
MRLIEILFDPGGRSNRGQYWFAIVAACLAVLVPASFLDARRGDSPAAFATFVGLLVSFAIVLTASIRRLHDRGKDGPSWLGFYYFSPVLILLPAAIIKNFGSVGQLISDILIAAAAVAALVLFAWMHIELGVLPGKASESNKHGADQRTS